MGVRHEETLNLEVRAVHISYSNSFPFQDFHEFIMFTVCTVISGLNARVYENNEFSSWYQRIWIKPSQIWTTSVHHRESSVIVKKKRAEKKDYLDYLVIWTVRGVSLDHRNTK